MSGRHRPAGFGGRRSLRAPLTLITAACLVAVTAVAVRVVAAGADGCSSGVKLSVAAAPEIAPAVQDAAQEWGQTRPDVNGKCIQVEVRPAAPADVAGPLGTRAGGHIDVAAKPAPTPREDEIPDVWIPDSVSWLARISAVDRSALGTQAPSLAMSPVVFGMPESVAQAMAPQLGSAGAAGLLQAALADAQSAIQNQRLPQLTVGILDPRRDTASLSGATIIREAVVSDESKVPSLIALYRLIYKSRVPDLPSLYKAFGQGVKVAPMSEQSVLAFNATNPPAPLAAVPLPAGSPTLDYPYATINGKSREVDSAASQFRAALTGPEYRSSFVKHGFRAPDGTAGAGFPAGHGVDAAPVTPNPLDDPARVSQTLGYWSAANAPSKALALIDVSSSMAQPLSGTTRMAVLQAAAKAGLSLFSDTSALGLWTFSSSHTELSPILPLNEQNRDTLNSRIDSARPSGSAESALYLAIRDAYKTMTETHNPEVANRIIVFTDGKSSTTGVKSLEQLNRELEGISVVTKPIEVTIIGVGPDVDHNELHEIARITDGVDTYVSRPDEIRSVFLKALLD